MKQRTYRRRLNVKRNSHIRLQAALERAWTRTWRKIELNSRYGRVGQSIQNTQLVEETLLRKIAEMTGLSVHRLQEPMPKQPS